MAVTICIASPKGGTGKTTCTRMLASVLHRKGYRVLMVDLVGLATLTRSLEADADLSGRAGAYRVLVDDAAKVSDCVHTTPGGECILSGSYALKDADTELQRLYDAEDLDRILAAKLQEVRGSYDYIVIDTPTAVNTVHMNALVASDFVVIAADPDEGSVQAVMQMDLSVKAARKANPRLKVAGVLLSFADPRTSLSQIARGRIDEQAVPVFGAGVFDTVIRRTVAMGEARMLCRDPVQYSPRCTAVKDYEAFADELMKKMEVE